ncbi:hypothetical protein [uncultured Algibacter sp.]|uniref:hypothetical protein n=1 Tax=uncultured Algibacter sp. TaxID=298659 RepID=UPI00261AA972|nr:hypothetical protein [uncultured Algibacter sp.]
MKRSLSAAVILSFFILSSCQDILECVVNRHPQLEDNRLGTAQVNNYYFEEIRADINNEPHDDRYYYYFSIDGELPRGLEFIVDYRSVIIEGRAQESGVYNFTIRLSVEQANDYYDECENRLNDCDGLCEDTTIERYRLVVN